MPIDANVPRQFWRHWRLKGSVVAPWQDAVIKPAASKDRPAPPPPPREAWVVRRRQPSTEAVCSAVSRPFARKSRKEGEKTAADHSRFPTHEAWKLDVI
jgi:hypothetical protein